MPLRIREAVNRIRTDAIGDLNHGVRTLKKSIGGVKRNSKGIPSMTTWGVDDNTGVIETFRRQVENCKEVVSLFKLQMVALMDRESRKIVGRDISESKAPTAEMTCNAVLDAIKKEGGVAREIKVENGFVFGKSLNVNGKEDDEGRTVVAGLASFGCALNHYGKMNPMAKGELEKGFDLLQRFMERHPGYAGRVEMLHASEKFKWQKRAILSGHAEPEKYRYTVKELKQRYDEIIAEYNSTPQHGHLNGLSPNEAHELMKDATNPCISFSPEMEWWLTNARYRVTVKSGGIKFPHYGKEIRVRGGRLANLIGEELWALVQRSDPSLVTLYVYGLTLSLHRASM